MALRWIDKGLGTEHGLLAGTRLFTLLSPVVEDGGHWTLSSDLPGPAAGGLVTIRHASAEAAKRRAHVFLHGWLERYTAELNMPPVDIDGPTYWDQGPRPGVQLRSEAVIRSGERTEYFSVNGTVVRSYTTPVDMSGDAVTATRCSSMNQHHAGDRCELAAGHRSLHAYGDRSWGDPCGAVGGERSELVCVRYDGHAAPHMSSDAQEWL